MSDKSRELKRPQTRPQDTGGFFNGVMFGAAVGAAAYYLFGTKEGQKLKDELIDLGKEQYEKFQQQAQSTPVNPKDQAPATEFNHPAQHLTHAIIDTTQQLGEALEKKVKTTQKEVVTSAKKTIKQVEKTAVKVEKNLKQDLNQELKQLQNAVTQAQKKADEMQNNLQQAASRIEKKFFTRKGRSLGK